MRGLVAGWALALFPALAIAQADGDDGSAPDRTADAAEFTTVEQTGARADGIRKNLERITLPDGFGIALYAVVPGARHMAVGPRGLVTFVGTRRSEVWSVNDRDGDGLADEVKNFAPSIAKKIPNGPCFSPDGTLYVVEQNRIVKYPEAESVFERPDVDAIPIVAQGALIPAEHESNNHSARVCRVGPDGKLYVALGQPYNVTPAKLVQAFADAGIGGIVRVALDGKGREVFASGIRNSVGMDFRPGTAELWFTDNQVDGMGDDRPPGELNRATEAGASYGFPWYGGGHVRTVEFEDGTPPAGIVFPIVEMVAHAADLGMVFYTGEMFPAEYRGAIFSAQHGSWNRTVPIGARVMVTKIAEDGTATSEVFASGWLDDETGEYAGRPVDVAQLRDGSLLVSDDLAGAVYRIWYERS